MKRKIPVFCLILSAFLNLSVMAAPSVSAPRAILMDAKTGLVLYEKNADETAYPASTTKLMTAILALEKGNMDDVVTVSWEAVNTISYDSSKAGLFEGESFSFRDMVYSLMVCSANDAANVIAEHIAGDISSFVELMNTRAKELGAENTHFVNAHGLHDEAHYTTAHDLAVLARHALSLPHFAEIVRTRSYILEPTDKYEEKRYLNSTNHLLNPQSQYYYQNAIGIKTGYTDNAKSCLISAAEAGDARYIAVVLGAESIDGQTMSFVDSRTLLSYGVESCPPVVLSEEKTEVEPIPVRKGKGTDAVRAHTAETVKAVLPSGAAVSEVEKLEYIKTELEAPVEAGQVIGKVEYKYQDMLVGETYLLAAEAVQKRSLIGSLFVKLFTSFWTWGVILIVLVVFTVSKTSKTRARNMRRRQAEIRRRNKYQ